MLRCTHSYLTSVINHCHAHMSHEADPKRLAFICSRHLDIVVVLSDSDEVVVLVADAMQEAFDKVNLGKVQITTSRLSTDTSQSRPQMCGTDRHP